MNPKRSVTVSKFLSKYLRHAPGELGLTLEPGGWVPIADLLEATEAKIFPVTLGELEEVVAGSDKQRFAFDATGTRIRANQGHSVEVDLQLEPTPPPAILYHGTPEANLPMILANGLAKMRRHHVHLSVDVPTAMKVGGRRGKPIILVVDSERMAHDGFTFFLSANGVWLTDEVPAQYLHVAAPPR
jgi:putative RNA 2'-phosphotransferase